MPPPDRPDWTSGPAKWAAVVVLGSASLAGMAWSILARQPRPVYSPAIVYREAPPPVSRVGGDPAPIAPDQGSGAAEAAEAIAPDGGDPPAGDAEPIPRTDPAPTRAININTATPAELELLPGVGPALAARIADYRQLHGPFKAVEELDHVSGIGPRTLEKIRPYATVR